MTISKRAFGRTRFDATIMGLGGEGILRTYGHESQAHELIDRAIDLGINYFESARAYSGSEAYYGLALKERRRAFASKLPWYTDMEPFFRFALSQPVTLAVIGCDNLEQLEQNVEFASSFKPMGDDEIQDLIDEVYPYGRKLMYYKP